MRGIRFKKRKIVENISINFLNNLAAHLFSFLMVIYAARVLQPKAYGKVSFVVSFVSYFVMFANLGMPIYGMRLCTEYKEDKKALGKVVNELWSIGIVLSLLSAFVLFLLTISVPRLRSDWMLFLIFGSEIFFQALGFEWFFKGLEQFRFLTICQIAVKAIALICMVLFLRTSGQLLLYAVLFVMAGYGSCLICFFKARKYAPFSLTLSINKQHFRPLVVFAMMSCAVSIYGSLDLTMLGFMKSDIETGLYSVASKGQGVLTMIGGIVWMSVLPRATSLWKNGDKRSFESLAGKSLVIVSAIQFAVTIVCVVFARWIIVLLGGNAFEGATAAFRILLLSLVPIGMSNILGGQVLIPAGRERNLLHAEIAGAVVNFIANLFVIPRFSIEGAAATTVLSEIVVTIWCFVAVKRELEIDLGLPLVAKVLSKVGRLISVLCIKLRSKFFGEKLPLYCPCCGVHINEFMDEGYANSPEYFNPARYAELDQKVICPCCGALPRHRILSLWMEKHIDELRGKKILHFAQEHSLQMWMAKNGISATTADLYAPADLQLDIEDTKLPDESYDVIICNHVLEHVSDFRKALRELHRIVAPDGMIIISFPTDTKLETVYEDASITDEEGRIKHFGQSDHLRVFGRDSASMLESFGFEVEEITSDDERIKPVVGPADYDYNVLWVMRRRRVSLLVRMIGNSGDTIN